MGLSYVEELAQRYFLKKGYIPIMNIRFRIDKDKHDKKVAGWSDIDILAINPSEVLIIQCKSFLGTKKAEEISEDILRWFDDALKYLEEDKNFSKWLEGREVKKILIIDYTIKKAEDILKNKNIGIVYYEELLVELLKKLSNDEWKKGKEDDSIIRLLCALLEKGLVNVDKLSQ